MTQYNASAETADSIKGIFCYKVYKELGLKSIIDC